MRKIHIPKEASKLHCEVYQDSLCEAVSREMRTCSKGSRAVWKKISHCLSFKWLLSSDVSDVIKAKEKVGVITDPQLRSEIKAIFNYERFCKGQHMQFSKRKKDFKWGKNSHGWSKNTYIKQLDINVCPYCNAELIGILAVERTLCDRTVSKEIALVDCDHFFSQDKYPYLALALANLVPCCSVCNERLKLSYEPSYPDFVHPFEDDFHELARFEVKPLKVGAVIGKLQGSDGIDVRVLSQTGLSNKVKGSADFWQLCNRYCTVYGADIRKLLLKSNQYESKEYLSYVLRLSSKRGLEDVIITDFGFDLAPDKINHNRLGKLTIDVMNDSVLRLRAKMDNRDV